MWPFFFCFIFPVAIKNAVGGSTPFCWVQVEWVQLVWEDLTHCRFLIFNIFCHMWRVESLGKLRSRASPFAFLFILHPVRCTHNPPPGNFWANLQLSMLVFSTFCQDMLSRSVENTSAKSERFAVDVLVFGRSESWVFEILEAPGSYFSALWGFLGLLWFWVRFRCKSPAILIPNRRQ